MRELFVLIEFNYIGIARIQCLTQQLAAMEEYEWICHRSIG